jgi:ribosomal protein S18 acetylase RimI-like enzyme
MIDVELMRREAEAPELVGPGDLEAVAQDLTAAFAADPVMNWFLRDDARREAARLAVFRLILRVSATPGRRVLRPASGGAAAIWIPSEEMTSNSLADELRALVVLLSGAGLARFPRVMAVRAAMDASHPMGQPHDYLSFLGVRPQAQGRGIGSRLLKVHTADLDARGRAAYLETGEARTLSLYRSHGFEITGDFRPGGDGPQMWSLWRAPQTP